MKKNKKKVHCPYCGAEAKIRPASVVYQENTLHSNTFLYVCDRYPKCDAYVGVHKETRKPMGTLANGDLRNKRIQAHKIFNQLWQNGYMTKRDAYKWMQAKFSLHESQAHIGLFSEYMCDQLIAACNEIYKHAQKTAS